MKRALMTLVRVTVLLAVFVGGIVVNAMVRGGGPRGLSSLRTVPVLRVLAPPPPPPETLHVAEEAEQPADEQEHAALDELATEMYLVPKPFSVQELSELSRKLEEARERYESRTKAVDLMLADLERVREDLAFRREELEQLRREIASAQKAHAADAPSPANTEPSHKPQDGGQAPSRNDGGPASSGSEPSGHARAVLEPGERKRLKAVAKIYESSPPEAAAGQLAALEPLEAAKILSVMKARSSGKVLAAMDVDRAVEVVRWLQSLRTAADAGQAEGGS